MSDDNPIRDQWYADDFETTTDLDGEPEPYTPTADDQAEMADLPRGGSRLVVVGMSKRNPATYTVTYRRSLTGTLTATKRSGRVHVWSWAIAEVGTTKIWTGATIKSYIEQALDLGGIHWFHNLRFDAAFIDAYLLDTPPHGLGMRTGIWRPRQVPTMAFSSLISDMGAHYSRNLRSYDGRTVELRDSLKKFPATTIERLAGMYGAPVAKGVIDYDAPRPVGYRPTAAEWEYLEADVIILRTALQVARDLGDTGLTIGGDAMREYRNTMEHGTFRQNFPLLDRETDEYIRLAYRGGWTYVNPLHQGKVLEDDGEVYDVNSMYPAVMRQEAYPVGIPVRLAPGQLKLKGFPHTIVGALLDAEIRPGRLPMIQIKNDGRYNPVEYQTSVSGVEWFGTEVDWKLLREQYTVKIHEWIGGLAFESRVGMFDKYIDKWMKVKETSTGGMRTQAKFKLNNLWGRFAINPLRANKLPGIASDGTPTYTVMDQEYGEVCYTPVGVWTTSYGRDRVIRAAQSFGDKFLAADTDSVHKLGISPGVLDVHETKLGAWKLESTFDQATYLRAKAYAERINGKVDAHVAGLPTKLLTQIAVSDLKVGLKFSGKLIPKRVPGGIILVSTDFEIGERDAWGHRA
jgi:hypothetical protein